LNNKRNSGQAIIACGVNGAFYGTIIGILFGLCLTMIVAMGAGHRWTVGMDVASLLGSLCAALVVGCALGALGGFIAGLIGGSFGGLSLTVPGFSIGGLVGGLAVSTLATAHPAFSLCASASFAGLLAGGFVDANVRQEKSKFPYFAKLQSMVMASELSNWSARKRSAIGWSATAFALILCLLLIALKR